MMHFSKRVLALVLVLCTVVTLFAGLTTVSAKNSLKRGTVCTTLSAQAKAYYADSYTYDVVSKLGGGTANCQTTVDSAMFKRLHTLMDSTLTNRVSYKSLTTHWPKTDNNILFYSDVQDSSYNREHVWPKSHGNFYESGAGSDLHHLRPTNATVNSTRNHWTFGNVKEHGITHQTQQYDKTGKTVLWYNAGYRGNDCLGLVEVSDNVKGDVARILLYVYTAYGAKGQNDNLFMKSSKSGSGNNANTGDKIIESLDTLLEWCETDPVDTWEMTRNDEVQNIQHNRNVFIDYPEYAWLLFGQSIPSDMTTPSGEAKKSGTSFKLTAVSDDESRGTVSVSGMTITAVPKAGCKVDDANPYTVTPTGAATVTRNGNVFTVSGMKSDCTVKINFAQKQAATVIFHTPSGTSFSGVSAAGMVSTYVGDSITLPSVTGKPNGTDYTFCGWATAAVGETTTAPSLRAASSSYTVTGSLINFYAVFSLTKDGKTYYNSEPKPEVTCAHEHTEPQHKDATCTEGGYDRTVCKDCGMELSGTTIPATGHSFKEGVCTVCGAPDPDYKPTCKHEHTKNETQDATCTVGGYDRTVCTDCGKELSVSSKPALGHEYKDGKCIRCGAAQPDEKPVNRPKYTDFADLPVESWYREGVSYALDRGLMNGVGSREFDPDGNVTRAMFVTILYRAENAPSVEGKSNPFTDVQNGKWYTEAVIWASDRGIVKGTSETTYSPDAPITREQMATILFRYSKSSPSDKSLSSFPDAGTVSSYAQNGMCWAVAEGIINGKDGKLAPKENATRCQIAAILMRYLEK